MHTVTVKMIADQEIEIDGTRVNVHEVVNIKVDGHGRIIDCLLEIPMPRRVWLSDATEQERYWLNHRED